MSTVIPLFNNVSLEKRLPNKSRMKLILPGAAEKSLGNWYVTAVGPDCKAVAVGDQVWFNSKEAGQEDFEGRRVIVVKESEIVAVIRE